MRPILFALFLLWASTAGSQSFQDFVNYVEGLPTPAAQQAAVDSLLDELAEAPLLEFDTLAHFLFQGAATSVEAPGDFNGWSPGADPLAPVGQTDLWYLTKVFEPNARLDYKFVLNQSSWILDPLNPHTVSGGFGPNSELAMPAYVQPWEIIPQPGIPHGTVETFSFFSEVLNGNYSIQIYLPPGYSDHPTRFYPSIYVQDGQEYLTLGSADDVLDNLIDEGSISELIGVFIRPKNRNEEYAFSKRTQYRTFVVEELVPHIESLYRVLDTPESRAVIGTSFGANISAQIAFFHPEVFGKAGLHSPAFWPNDFETAQLLLENDWQPIQWAAVWGTYETSIFESMEIIQPALEDLGYDFYGNYYPEGHSWGLWRATLDELLIELFPPGLVDVHDSRYGAAAQQVWPNPVKAGQTLFFGNAQPAWGQLFDASGQRVANWTAPAGSWKVPVHLPAGWYTLVAAHAPPLRLIIQ